MDYLDSCFEKSTEIVTRKIADEIILVPVRKQIGDLENIYTLDEVSVRIWELIDGNRKLADIKEIIVEEFDVSEDEAKEDLIGFIKQLESIEGIKEVKRGGIKD